MFGNNKRKPQDDEESLVPHGLIWHATAEPTPEEVAKNEEALGYTLNYAQEIERVRREQSAQPMDKAPDAAAQAPPENPVVIPWWRLQQPEPAVERPISKPAPMPLSAYVPTPIEPASQPSILSRIDLTQSKGTSVAPMTTQPELSKPAVQPIQAISSAPIAPPVPISQASTPRVEGSMAKFAQPDLSPARDPVVHISRSSKPAEDRLVPESSEFTEALALVFSRLRSAGEAAWLSLGSVSRKVIQRGRQTVQSLELGEALMQARKQGQNVLRGGIAKTRTTRAAVGAFSRAGVSRVQQMSARVRTASTTSSADVMRPANTQPSTPSRVRLGLAASALQARIFTARQLSAWRLRRERMAIDSRFWASMTLAAIAAIITLVIVSVVPHYAARSLPSRLLNTNPSVSANVAAAPSNPGPVQKADVPVRKAAPGTQTVTPKTSSAKASSAKAAPAPKPRHVVHDDYVAPNTYKYYGTGSKPSR